MLLRKAILGRGFSTSEEAVAPLVEALQARKDIVGAVTLPASTFTCFAPTYGRWGGRFRFQARVWVRREEERSSVIFELERPTLVEALHIVLIFAFWVLMTGLGDHRYLGLGIVMAILSVAARAIFLIVGADRIADVFASAYAPAHKKAPNQLPEPTSGLAPGRGSS